MESVVTFPGQAGLTFGIGEAGQEDRCGLPFQHLWGAVTAPTSGCKSRWELLLVPVDRYQGSMMGPEPLVGAGVFRKRLHSGIWWLMLAAN